MEQLQARIDSVLPAHTLDIMFIPDERWGEVGMAFIVARQGTLLGQT